MGIIKNFVKETAKDTAIFVAAGIMDKIDEMSEKKSERRKNKLMNERRSNLHLLISYVRSDRGGLFGNHIKAKYYDIEDGISKKYSVKRTSNKKGIDHIDISCQFDQRYSLCIEEFIERTASNNRNYYVHRNGTVIGKIIVAMDRSSASFFLNQGDRYEVFLNSQQEYTITHMGIDVGHCRKEGLKLKNEAMMVDYIVGESEEYILSLSTTLMLSFDRIVE